MEPVTILCMKWGSKYGPEYVNNLHNMVRRHLRRPHRFVCLTDDPGGIQQGVDCLPIPELQLPPNSPERGWTKLVTYTTPLYDIRGTVLFLDLDLLVVDAIDCLFEPEGAFMIIKDWVKRGVTGNSSVYRFQAGAHPDVLDYFRAHFPEIRRRFRNEQEFLSDFLARQGKLRYWPAEWCRSFKHHCIRKGLAAWIRPPQQPPGARIVVFHGKPNPPDAVLGRGGKWYRPVLPAPWVAEHWR
jgi:hypothetical protein